MGARTTKKRRTSPKTAAATSAPRTRGTSSKAVGPEWEPALGKIRDIIKELPGTIEVLHFGQAAWKAGKGARKRLFASVGVEQGAVVLSVAADPFERPVLLKDPRFLPSRYQGALMFHLAGPTQVDLRMVRHLLEVSHAIITGKIPR